jgi:ribonuclease HIII
MEIRHVKDHVEIYENGKFVVSGDNKPEAIKDYNEIMEERNNGNCIGTTESYTGNEAIACDM